MTSANELEEWARKNIDWKDREEFVGVFMADQLADASAALRRSGARVKSLIFNYDPAGKPGSHWVAARITPRELEWFDSYGQRPDGDDPVLRDRTQFTRWCEKNAPRGLYKYNTLDFQALESAVCGQYALWFCKHGLPDADSPAWRPFYTQPGFIPQHVKGLPSLWRQDQTVAKARDDLIRELVQIRRAP